MAKRAIASLSGVITTSVQWQKREVMCIVAHPRHLLLISKPLTLFHLTWRVFQRRSDDDMHRYGTVYTVVTQLFVDFLITARKMSAGLTMQWGWYRLFIKCFASSHSFWRPSLVATMSKSFPNFESSPYLTWPTLSQWQVMTPEILFPMGFYSLCTPWLVIFCLQLGVVDWSWRKPCSISEPMAATLSRRTEHQCGTIILCNQASLLSMNSSHHLRSCEGSSFRHVQSRRRWVENLPPSVTDKRPSDQVIRSSSYQIKIRLYAFGGW